MPSSARLIFTLGLISMMSGLLVVLTYQLTQPRIEQNRREAMQKAIFKVLPAGTETTANFILDSSGLTLLEENSARTPNLFAGYSTGGELTGLAMEASARGYQDVVKILYGYSLETECIIGITVLESRETPGLGDKVETDKGFLANFDCLEATLNQENTALAHDIVTVKNGRKTDPWQIDGISGATVTSTAIGTALRESANSMLPLLARHKEDLRMNLNR